MHGASRSRKSPADALKALGDLLTFLHVLPIPATAAQGLMGLLQRHPVSGGDVFDLQIVSNNAGKRQLSEFTPSTAATFEAVSGISVTEP